MEKIAKKPFLLYGKIFHERFTPKNNKFTYKSLYISSPLSKISLLKKSIFSINKANIYNLNYKNYGDSNPNNIESWIRDILTKHNISNIAEIILVTHPKTLGYVFNPVSFWLCLDKEYNIIAVLSEVNNTCGQKHNYLCFNQDLTPIKSNQWLKANKEFYVSPFLEIKGEYRFMFEHIDNDDLSKQELNFFINYIDDDKIKLTTYLKCSFKEYNNFNLFVSLFKVPFATLKTTILIHYQALKLYSKKIKYYKCPDKLKNNLTINKNAK